MTVKSLEGTLVIPAATDPQLNLNELGWRSAKIPQGICALSEVFFPDPTNDPNATVLFNVFIVSTTFDGDVYLVKRPPAGGLLNKRWCRPLKAGQNEWVWAMKPQEAITDTVQETENSVSYALAAFGAVPGQQLHWRFSL